MSLPLHHRLQRLILFDKGGSERVTFCIIITKVITVDVGKMEVSEGLISKIHTSFAGGIHFASPVSSLRTTEFELVSALISCRQIIIEFLPRITKYVLSLRNDFFFFFCVHFRPFWI